MLDGDEVGIVDAARVRDRERETLHGARVQRSPYIDEPDARFQRFVGVRPVREMEAHASGGAGRRLVDVDFDDGGAGSGGTRTADGVVEDEDAGGRAGDGGVAEEEALDFWIIVAFDEVVGLEGRGCSGAGDLGQRGEGVGVEIEGRGCVVRAYVADGDFVDFVAVVALWDTFRLLFDVVVWFGVIGGWVEEV